MVKFNLYGHFRKVFRKLHQGLLLASRGKCFSPGWRC